MIFDDSVITDNRDFLWDINVDLQHEIVHGLSVDVGYNHNWDGNFTVTGEHAARTRRTSTSSASRCRTIRASPHAGQQQCGYYDIKPAFFGQGTLRVTNAKEFVEKNGNTKLPQRYWDGIWVSANGRLPRRHHASAAASTSAVRSTITASRSDIPNQPNDITGAERFAGWNGLNCQRRTVCHVDDVVDGQHWTSACNGSVPIKGGFNAQLHLPQHAWGGPERDPDR